MTTWVTGLPAVGKTTALRRLSTIFGLSVLIGDELVINCIKGLYLSRRDGKFENAKLGWPLKKREYLGLHQDPHELASRLRNIAETTAKDVGRTIAAAKSRTPLAIEVSPILLSEMRPEGSILLIEASYEQHLSNLRDRWKCDTDTAVWLQTVHSMVFNPALNQIPVDRTLFMPEELQTLGSLLVGS